ncbi:Hypothetical protein D9617_10g072480 [Elsinoe fawcettii]|nr:Hypothetical protein D9617_10g072480 [Elsinoe fawcettii]
MRGITTVLLAWLVEVVVGDSFVYSFDQRDVKPLKPQRAPLMTQPMRKREEPADYTSHNHLFPAIHPHHNKRDVQHLRTRQDHSLFYTKNGGIYLEDADMVATLDATFHWEAVILDHTAFVQNVTCQPEQMSIKLDSIQSLNTAKTNWTGDTIVFVSSDKSCHTTFPGQFGFFNTSSVSYNQKTLTAVAKGKQISVEQAIKEFNVVWGQWESAGKPKTEQQAAAALRAASSSSRISSFSSSTQSSSSSSVSLVRSSSGSPAVAALRATSAGSSRSQSSTSSSSPLRSSTVSKAASSSTTAARSSTTVAKSSTTVAKSSTTVTKSSTTVVRSSTTAAAKSSTTPVRSSTTAAGSSTTAARSSTSTARPTTTVAKSSTTGSQRTSSGASKSSTTQPQISSKPTTTASRTSTGPSTQGASSTTRPGTTAAGTSSSALSSTGRSSVSSSAVSSARTTSSAGIPVIAAAGSSSATTSVSSPVLTPALLNSTSTIREVFETLVPPTGTGKCGAVPSPVPSGFSPYFKQVDCDNSFDKHVDDFFTYLRDVSNLNSYLKSWAPNTGITSADITQTGSQPRLIRRGVIQKRGFGDFIVGVVRVIKAIVDVVVAVVRAVVTAVRNLAESLLPTWNPSASFTIPVALEPPSRLLDECPWGDGGFELWKWTPEGAEAFDPLSSDTLAKMTGADQILTFEIDGVEQLPEPGVTVWCVDCGIHGSILTTGSATFTIIGPTRLSLRLRGDLNANVQLGVDGFYKFERPILEIPLTPDIGLPGFSIPGVISIGPYLTVDLVAKIEVETVGQFLAGINLDWPEMGMFVDFLSPGSAKSYGYAPIVTPIFKASGEITATASLGIPIGINVGVNVLNGIYEESIALVDTPAIQAVAEYSASYDNQDGGQLGGDECPGIYFYSNLVNSLELEIPLVGAYELGKWEGPKFIEGCVNDNGVTTVRQQEQPAVGGETKAGCKLVDNVFRNGEFSSSLSYWTPLVGHDNADLGVQAEWTNGELSVHRETFDTGGCFIRVCLGTCLASGECDGGCDSSCPQPNGPWKFTVKQTVDLCTYSQYNAELSGRIERGNDRTGCKVNKWFLNGVESNSQWLKREYTVDKPILPKTSQNPGNLPIGDPSQPIAITIPSRDNAASYKVEIGVEVECTSDDFDVRLDDFRLAPDASAFMKRDLQARRNMIVAPELATIHSDNSLRPRQVPTIPQGNTVPSISAISQGNAAPTIPAANAAPTLEVTQAAPAIPAANAAPTLPPNLEAPAFQYVPGGNLVGGTYTLGAAVPTATAVFIGPNKYKFPAFSDIMASATVGVVGAAPTAGSNLPYTGWGSLTNFDPRSKSRLAAAEDGNFYMVADNGAASPGTQFYSQDSVAFKDEAERMFHYYPNTMAAYGVSRLRVAQVLDTPLGAQMVTLVPVATPNGVAYVAADTDGHNYLLAWCSAPRWQGSKVFLVGDYEKGLQTLQSGEVQWVVTGNNVTECDTLVLTSQAGGLTPQ